MQADEITKAIGRAVDSIPVYGDATRLEAGDACNLDGYWSLAALTEAIRAALLEAGYVIAPATEALLAKGNEAVKLHE